MIQTTSTFSGVTVNCRDLVLSFDGVCPLCNKLTPCDDWRIGHDVDPRRGGAHTLANCLILCKFCRWRKGWLTMDQILDLQREYEGAVYPVPTGFWHTMNQRDARDAEAMFPAAEGWGVWRG